MSKTPDETQIHTILSTNTLRSSEACLHESIVLFESCCMKMSFTVEQVKIKRSQF